jgi:2-methylisocitrate lyase-like PEP mutase family enzyme
MDARSKAERLRELHHGPDPLLLVNAWDGVSARLSEAEGFPAVATGSAGCAAVLGYPDGERIPRAEMLFLAGAIARSVEVPVTADVEAGYDDPVETALDLIRVGVVGLNLEDMAGRRLFSIEEAAGNVRAIRSAATGAGVPTVINARTELYLAKHGDETTRFDRAVERLNAYFDAGADCLFAPGVTDAETIGRLVAALKGPLNILATVGTPPIEELRRLGVRRVSFGSGPSRVALGAYRRIVREIRDHGTFAALATEAIPYSEVQGLHSRG